MGAVPEGSKSMNRQKSFTFIHILLFVLAALAGCTYSIPENGNSKEYSTPSPNTKKEAGREDTTVTDAPFEQGETVSLERDNNPPVAGFNIKPDDKFYTGMNILFDAGSSMDPDGDYLEYYWDFGDGSPLFGPTSYNPVCHRYLIKGIYTIRLTVLDNFGGFSIMEKLIHILDK